MSRWPVAWLLALVLAIRGAYSMAEEGGAMGTIDVEALVRALDLEPHVEGGYFRRTFQADHRPGIATPAGERFTLSAIHYLLTRDAPIGRWHRNRSDILHFWHLGAPVHYYMIHPDGRLETAVLGPDILNGQQLQLVVRGGVWKASHLPAGDYGLISEAVAPGFDYADMTLGEQAMLLEMFPAHAELIRAYAPAGRAHPDHH